PCGIRLGVEMDPDAVHLDPPTRVAADGPSAARGDRGHAAAPRGQLDCAVLEERSEYLDPHAADEPQMLGRSPAGLLDVLDRDVLEEPGDRVETQATAAVHVGEADPPARREGPAVGRDGDASVEHARSLDHRRGERTYDVAS